MMGGHLLHTRDCGDRILLWIAVAGSDVEEIAGRSFDPKVEMCS